jgi:hypothetical protein
MRGRPDLGRRHPVLRGQLVRRILGSLSRGALASVSALCFLGIANRKPQARRARRTGSEP